MTKNFHEQFAADAPPLPSERSTGLVFTAVALIVAYVWRDAALVRTAALAAAALLLVVSLLVPSLLKPLNVAWFKLALLLNRIVSPIVMLVLFLIAIVPFGLAMQLRQDPLRKRRRPGATTYWIERSRDGPVNDMSNQF